MRDKSSHRRPINGPGGIRGRPDGPAGPHVHSPADPYLPDPNAALRDQVTRDLDARVTSRAPLLESAQVAQLIGAGTLEAWVRRNLPGSVTLGPRRRAWPVEAVEAFTSMSYSDAALRAVGCQPYSGSTTP